MESKPEIMIGLRRPVTGSDFELPVKSHYVPNRYLGVWKAGNLTDDRQYEVLKKKSKELLLLFNRTASARRGA